MRYDRVREIVLKDLSELRANRSTLISLVIFPVFLLFSALAQVQSAVAGASPGGADLRDAILGQTVLASSLLMLIAPLIAVVVGSTGIILEKTNRSLEPLLADPISDSELLWGKALAALIPALATGYAAFLVLFVAGDAIAWGTLGGPLYPSIFVLYQMFVLMTLLALIGTFSTVIISSRAKDIRAAQQISMLVVLPVVAAAIVGIALAGTSAGRMGVLTVALGLSAGLVVRIAIRRFHRESILVDGQ
ncbi:MAG: ABC transporter permease subunit [Thermoplasmata archaeon]|nr:ABC transporter permease subunit [Thermoplasmata archaeon]